MWDGGRAQGRIAMGVGVGPSWPVGGGVFSPPIHHEHRLNIDVQYVCVYNMYVCQLDMYDWHGG
jgi:hypothetical protein